jgi:lipopolysaccharide transport system ATP-binding protein
MSKDEIRRKFDEIVAFAEIEKFIDTPVKRYSSGMYVRLAFGVAAHLEPEILIVDEVLAVGDAAFQKKCIGKMEDVGKEGRTVLFVSHQMGAIQRLCGRVIVLGNGKTVMIGDTKSAIDFYLGDMEEQANFVDLSSFNRSGSGTVKLTSFSLENSHGDPVTAVASGDPLFFVFGYRCEGNDIKRKVSIGFSLHNALGDTLVVFYSDYMGVTFDLESEGIIKCRVDDFPFSAGRYFIGARVVVNGMESDWPKGFIGLINVEAGDFYGDGNLGNAGLGPILLRGKWAIT